jgi:glutathione S-transferase
VKDAGDFDRSLKRYGCTLIAECTAITEYLDALDGVTILTGRTPRERSLIRVMNKRAELELLGAISVYFHHATPGPGPEVEVYQNAVSVSGTRP